MKLHKVYKVRSASIAEEVGIVAGDIIQSISGQEIRDVLDYLALTSEDEFSIEVLKSNGDSWTIEIEKEFDEDLGIEFDDRIMDIEKPCENKCVFCFIDQLPKGLRSSLYFKDDDWRLSFLMGNYVTLTNLSSLDVERIIQQKISPLYVSVHSTDERIRKKMTGNKTESNIMDILKLLKDGGISIQCQIVVCPGMNDGEEFDKTITDLLTLVPELKSVAVVPVGLTKHREKLPDINPFNSLIAKKMVGQVEKWQKICLERHNTSFVWAADELYLMAGLQMPKAESYEGFHQLENGVGLISKFLEEFGAATEELDSTFSSTNKISIATGVSAFPIFHEIANTIRTKYGIDVEIFKVVNKFFGESVTVAGLLTAQDLISQLKGENLGTKLLIPLTMLRAEGDLFLDDLTVQDVEEALSVKVTTVPVDGRELLIEILRR